MSNSVGTSPASVVVLVAATHSENRNLLEPPENYPNKVLVKYSFSKSKNLLELPKNDQNMVLVISASEKVNHRPQLTNRVVKEVLVSQQGLKKDNALFICYDQ